MKEHNWLKVILTPLSWIYGLITSVRNILYDKGILASVKPKQFIISIGNLTVGGTGKTPMTEYLARLLLPTHDVAILSRGYGRKTKGFMLANRSSTADDIGDEPLQYYRNFKGKLAVAVCENRVKGAEQINHSYPQVNLLLLDDAFQHRAIKREMNLLLNDFNRPFYDDLPFPAGRLRETRAGANRADAVIVTKCPSTLTKTQKDSITKSIQQYSSPTAPIFFSYIQYEAPVGYNGEAVQLKNVKLMVGIANPQTFIAYMRQEFNVIEEIIFPDHHNYVVEDLEQLIKYLKNDTFVVTTEKDMVKLKPLVDNAGITAHFAYLPIAVNFKDDTGRFNQWIRQQIQ